MTKKFPHRHYDPGSEATQHVKIQVQTLLTEAMDIVKKHPKDISDPLAYVLKQCTRAWGIEE